MTHADDVIEIEGQDDLDLTAHPHPMGTDTEVRIAKDSYSVFEFLRQEKKGSLVLAPDFQRNDVWNAQRQSELIESIIMGIPIPVIYLFENHEGKRQIIDGKQRTTALKKFINNQFPLKHLMMLSDLNGSRFDDIPPLLQAKLEDYQLNVYIIQPPTPEYVKFNIFERVNRGGMNLNKQEMRHALYQGKCTLLIEELANSSQFKNATGNGVNPDRMRDRYLVLRFIAFYLLVLNKLPPNIQYRSDIDSFLASVMIFINSIATDALIEEIKQWCLIGMERVYEVVGSEAYRFAPKYEGGNRRPINMGLFEMLTFTFCYVDVDALNYEKANILVKQYKADIDSEGYLSGSMDTLGYVELRFDTAHEIAEGLNNA
ncbi:DUF262 domain-containing protein [Photobacterium leiognathi]|uniref:DUF262 domain-containing protein n=1 Tax=Photobacterium leiognathi TaxID=553611 RepID=A0A2T3M7Z1_PHOLE|nr:DUF262 domain-containing protein [Photobacterium leiognathi]KJF97406.1 hypothetical protein UB34_12835 [Photobacterium leiognathi]PSV88266.1 DUF262 domain-containing protein [Photobacterium leiognathi]